MITGATSGIGKETAILFAKEGAHVALLGRDQAKGEAVVDLIKQNGNSNVFFSACNVAKESEVKAFVEQTLKHFGRLDCAFNNAGIGGVFKPLTELEEDEWDDVMNINLKGVWLCLKHQISAMIKNDGPKKGSIVNTSSRYGVRATEAGIMLSAYVTSKHALMGLTKVAASEFVDKGIRVNSVCPGWIPTEGNNHLFIDPAMKANIDTTIPMGDWGTKEDIAEAVLWYCSDKSGYITGDTMLLDGGMTLR
ncbi:MAG: SDR family oxidoreductase [Algicola sp.]|nr:SDR family oxidoreductase [Algicola sp.]